MQRRIYLFFPILMLIICFILAGNSGLNAEPADNKCVNCHSRDGVTPLQVKDWRQSKHALNDITCDICHGDGHQSADDIDKVNLPNPDVCGSCHEEVH